MNIQGKFGIGHNANDPERAMVIEAMAGRAMVKQFRDAGIKTLHTSHLYSKEHCDKVELRVKALCQKYGIQYIPLPEKEE